MKANSRTRMPVCAEDYACQSQTHPAVGVSHKTFKYERCVDFEHFSLWANAMPSIFIGHGDLCVIFSKHFYRTGLNEHKRKTKNIKIITYHARTFCGFNRVDILSNFSIDEKKKNCWIMDLYTVCQTVFFLFFRSFNLIQFREFEHLNRHEKEKTNIFARIRCWVNYIVCTWNTLDY